MDKINRETLISLVEERDILWDITLEGYKDKRKTLQAWRDICRIINENFVSLPEVEKNKYAKVIVKKWKAMRDEWMKCHRKLSESKSGSEANSVHKYTYYDNMKFLTKITKNRDTTESNVQPSCNSESNDSHYNKEKNLSAVDRGMIQYIDSLQKEENKNDDSRVMSFFKSIAPTVEKFSDEDVVEFQYQVLAILRDLNKKNLNRNTPTSQMMHLHQPIQTQPTLDTQGFGYSSAAEHSNVRSQPKYRSEIEFDYTQMEQSQPSVQFGTTDELDFESSIKKEQTSS